MIGIIILNYLTWKDTIECMNSIKMTYKGSYRIYVVDNKSPDDSESRLRKVIDNNENAVYIQTHKNIGYAAGNNIGIKRAIQDQCEYIMISNSDVLFHDGSINGLINFMKSNEFAGIAAPSTLNANGECSTLLRNRVTNLRQIIIASTFLRRKFKKIRKSVFLEAIMYKEPTEIDVLSGCCLIFKKETFDLIGLLDESTFLYSEEYILERRLSYTNYKSFYVPDAIVTHNHGTSTKQLSLFSFIKSVESGLYYAKAYLELPAYKIFVFYMLKLFEYISIARNEDAFFMNFKKYLITTMPILFKSVKVYQPLNKLLNSSQR